MNYKWPQTYAGFNDWPFGRDLHCTCIFRVVTHPIRGQRVRRETSQPYPPGEVPPLEELRFHKPKFTTYARYAAIVTGKDGKTYILQKHDNHITVVSPDTQHTIETVYPTDKNYFNLCGLLGKVYDNPKILNESCGPRQIVTRSI